MSTLFFQFLSEIAICRHMWRMVLKSLRVALFSSLVAMHNPCECIGKTAIREFQGNRRILECQTILDYCSSMITTVTGKNQVTVPAEIVRKEGLRPGTRLEWRSTEREHVLEVRVLPDPASIAAYLRGRGNANRRLSGSPVDRLVRERKNEAR